MKILTLNVRGIRQHRKQRMLGSLLEALNVEIAFLQETHFGGLQEARSFEDRIAAKGYFSFGTSRSCGVAILTTRRFRGRVLKFSFDVQGRLITADISLRGQIYRIASIYAPTDYQDRNDFFRTVDPYLLGRRNLIVGGDFNCVLDDSHDRTGGTSRNQPWKAKELRRLIRACDFVDVWTHTHGTTPGFTFSAQDRHVRLDRVYVSRVLEGSIASCDVVQVGTSAQYFSDHKAVVLSTEDAVGFGPQRPPWRLNLSLLDDQNVEADIRAYLGSRFTEESRSPEWWDSVKSGVRAIFQMWGKRLASQRRRELSLLQAGLRGLLADGLSTEQERAAYKELQADLSGLLARRSQGWRPTAHDMTGRRSARASLADAQRSPPVPLDQLTKPDGSTVTEIDDIVSACKQFYEELYTRLEGDSNLWPELLLGFPHWTEDQAADLDFEISVSELHQAAKRLARGSTPGSDGLPLEFYLCFWDVLGVPLCQVITSCIERGLLPPSSRCGLIKLLCKDERRRTDLGAWRPITLLNADYKIFAKVLQLRLGRVLDLVISPAQASAVPGRTIQQHLFALRDICYWAVDRRASAFLLSADQEKAFDRVCHDFMFHVLHRSGLGERFQGLVRLLYTDAESKVVVNGRSSQPFPVQRGVRQGCPLSPLLYVLVFEAAITSLSRESIVPRLPVPGSQCFPTLFAYADDLTICLASASTVSKVIECLEIYGRASGAAVNRRKSSILPLGSEFPYSDVCGIPVCDTSRILGIHFNRRGPLTNNWTRGLRDMEDRLRSLSGRDLSLRERAVLISRRVSSRLWFFGTAFQPAIATARRAHRIMHRFFWDNRPERVSRDILVRPPEHGGWSIPDVRLFCAALGLTALFSAIRDSRHIAHHLAMFFLGTFIRDFGGVMDHTRPHAERLMPFYRIMREFAVALHRALPESDFTTWTTRQIYEALCDLKRPIPSSRSDANRRRIAWNILDGSRVDVLWQLSHNVLPVRTRLHRFRLSRTDRCATCAALENHHHVFYGCVHAAAMWRKVAGLYGLVGVTYDTIRYLDPIPVPTRKHPAFVLLVAEVVFQLWCSRTRAVYGSQSESLLKILLACKIGLKQRLQDDLHSLGIEGFRRRWRSHHDLFILANGNVVVKL